MTVFYIVAAIILYFFLQKKVSRSFTIPDTAELRDERDERKMVNIVMDKATADAKKIARMYCGYYIIPTLIVIPLLVFIMIDDEILIRQTIKYITRMLFWGIIVSYFSYNMLHNAIIDAVKDTWVEFLKSMKTDDTNIAIKAEVAKPSIQSFFVIPITGIAGFAVLYKLGAGAEYTILVLSLTLIELVVITKQYMREYKNWRKNE
ncbi:hypothetical protein FACS189467_5230 [Bacteroidia bacterium]|nr:hypothetical protein FACS189467_5230 [Bacteroidia bacterium]